MIVHHIIMNIVVQDMQANIDIKLVPKGTNEWASHS